MKDRDPYPKPAAAKDAAVYLVRAAVEENRTLEELIAGRYGIYRPDYNAVVGRVFGARPPRTVRPDEIGVIGFDQRHEGVVFSAGELWEEAREGQKIRARQARLF